MSFPTELLVLCLLIFANGVLAMAETAVVSARKTKLRQLAEAGDKGATQALRLPENPDRLLALVEFWLTLSGMIVGVLAGVEFGGWLIPWLVRFAFVAPYASWISPFVV